MQRPKTPPGCAPPVSNPVPSFWTSASSPLYDHRTTSDLPSECDIVIIGAGFSGVATAHHIFKEYSSPSAPSVVLLDARSICCGATGRNGGHVKPDVYFGASKYAPMYGMESAAEMARFEADQVYAVKRLVEAEGLDCDFHLTRAVDVFLDPEHARETEAAYRDLVRAGGVDLNDVDFTPRKDAERVSGVKGAQCCFSFTAAHLWPLKMVHQLLERLVRRGAVNVQANTPVTSISSSASDADGLWTVATPRGTIRAAKVVHATNAYTCHLLPEYRGRIVPVRGVCSRIVTPHGPRSPHLINTYGIRYDAQNYDYLIPRADGSIVVGGARQVLWDKPELWFDNIRDDEVVGEAATFFEGYMQRTFCGWEESNAKVDSVWTGVMGFSSDFMPHVGEVPGKPGQFIMAGFSGHGMPQILGASLGLAKMLCTGAHFEDTGLPRIMKTSADRIAGTAPSPLEESLGPASLGNTRIVTASKL